MHDGCCNEHHEARQRRGHDELLAYDPREEADD
jgi:hypothetical protein